jgi:sulfhydrogenase subunit delta
LQAIKPRIGLYGFTGCAGDLLTIIHSEDELFDFFGAAQISSFLMAQSNNLEGPLDIGLIEGSITTEEQAEDLTALRNQCPVLVAIGTCACYGGIQAMRVLDRDWADRYQAVYGQRARGPAVTLTRPFESRPVDAIVKVDYYLPGCPIDRNQFFHLYSKLIRGYPYTDFKFPVCVECKWHENECLLLKGELCLGPITAQGCGAICPSLNLPCIGCFGPADEANLTSEFNLLKEKGFSIDDVRRRLLTFGGPAMAKRFEELLKPQDA